MIGDDRLRALAAAALPYWNGAEARLVKARENVVFEMILKDGNRAALRLHRPGYQSRGAIAAELDWTARLAAAGLGVPAPIRTRGGRMTATVGGRVASAVRWLDGSPVGAAERPLGGDGRDLLRRIGALVAQLHNATDALGLPADFDRPRWDAEALLGDRPRWGRFWENPGFTPDESRLVATARQRARHDLDDFARQGGDFGLIHADVLRENVLAGPDGFSLIDFDDSGWGFRMYDLGTALVQNLEEPEVPALADALIKGYRAHRPLSDSAARRLPLFTLLRTFASAGWIVSRATADDPRQRFYADRAARMAAAFLSGGWPAS